MIRALSGVKASPAGLVVSARGACGQILDVSVAEAVIGVSFFFLDEFVLRLLVSF